MALPGDVGPRFIWKGGGGSPLSALHSLWRVLVTQAPEDGEVDSWMTLLKMADNSSAGRRRIDVIRAFCKFLNIRS
jgi:hypothetical protein